MIRRHLVQQGSRFSVVAVDLAFIPITQSQCNFRGKFNLDATRQTCIHIASPDSSPGLTVFLMQRLAVLDLKPTFYCFASITNIDQSLQHAQ